jgi:hypothetical protein
MSVVFGACVFAPLGPYGEPGLDFLDGLSENGRAGVRLFFTDRPRARANFRADAAEQFGRMSVPAGWLARWGDQAGTDAARSREMAEHLALCSRDGMRDGDQSWWDDWVAFLHPGSTGSGTPASHQVEDPGPRYAGQRWRGVRRRPDPLLKESGERLCPVGAIELQVQHQVFRVVHGLADREAADAGLRARIGEAVERRLPQVIVVDRMLDPERDHRPVLSLAAFRRAVCCRESR